MIAKNQAAWLILICAFLICLFLWGSSRLCGAPAPQGKLRLLERPRDASSVPIFVNNYQLLNWPRNMVRELFRRSCSNIIIIDNKSTYPPLLDWYASAECRKMCRVISLKKNLGHLAFFKSDVKDIVVDGGNYVLTDPDLDLSKLPFDFMSVLEEVQAACANTQHADRKVGLALALHDLPCTGSAQKVCDWEKQWWSKPTHLPALSTKRTAEYPLYQSAIDTTFFLHNRKEHAFPSIRVGGPCTVRHLMWYDDLNKEDDVVNYRNTNKTKTHWS